MIDDEALLRAYDEQLRRPAHPGRLGIAIEHDGPLLRVAGQARGFITGPPDLGLDGAELDALIARQRDFFAARGQAVEWKTRVPSRREPPAHHSLQHLPASTIRHI